MVSKKSYAEIKREGVDGTERHEWGSLEYVDGGGAVVKPKGNGTEDEEMAVLVIGGTSFNLPKDTNTEIFALAGGDDTNLKFAVITIPRDKQRKWAENTGGIQNPIDPDKALEFNTKRTHATEANFAVGMAGLFEIKDGVAYFRVPVHIPDLKAILTGAPSVPGFEA